LRARERSVEISAVATNSAGGTDRGQRCALLTVRTGWRLYRCVALGHQEVRQAHQPAGAGRVRVEHAVAMGGQICVDLIERFRAVNASSFQEAIGVCQR
jgi:hypothetical protein